MSPRPRGRRRLRAAAVSVAGLFLGLHAGSSASAGSPRATAASAALRDEGALTPFFDRLAALERSGAGRVRILWLGDSHVAADLLTGHVRRLLQARFGDAGPGLVMPGDPWRYFRHDRARSRGDGGFETVGPGRDAPDPFVGLWGVALLPRREGSARLDATFAEAEVAAVAPVGEGCLAVSLDGVTAFAGELGEAARGTAERCARVAGARLGSGALVAFVAAGGPKESPRTLEVRDACGGEVRVLGADLLSGRPGVLVDSVGMNGAEIGWLGRADREVRRALLERLDPALIVVSLGTNDMGRPDLVPGDFEEEAVGRLRALREDAPRAAVLVAGPLDRAGRTRWAKRVLAANEPAVHAALRRAAKATGSAFVDQRALMGGEGSVRAWARRKLAAPDLVHLSRGGYERVAAALVDLLLGAYDASRSARAGR